MLEILGKIFVANFHIISALISGVAAYYFFKRFKISSFKEKFTVVVGTLFAIYALSFLFAVWSPLTWKTFIVIGVAVFLEKNWSKVNSVWERPFEMIAISMLFFAMFLNIKLHSFVEAASISSLKMTIFTIASLITGFLTGIYTKQAFRKRHILNFHFKKGHRVLLNKIALLVIIDLLILMIFTGSEMVYFLLLLSGVGVGFINSMCEDDKYKDIWNEFYLFFLSLLLVFVAQITHNYLILLCSVILLLHSIKRIEEESQFKLKDIKTVLISYLK